MYGNGPELQCTHLRVLNVIHLMMTSQFLPLMIDIIYLKEVLGFQLVILQHNIPAMLSEGTFSNMQDLG